MKVKPIVLIGNGPSISGFDWGRLDGVDTMAMNAFSKVCESSGWFPTYYCLFRKLEDIWGDEMERFVVRRCGKMRRVFYVNRVFDDSRVFGDRFDGIENAVPINKAGMDRPPEKRYGGVLWQPPLDEMLAEVESRVVAEVGDDEGRRLLAARVSDVDEGMTVDGMVKWVLHGESGEYGDSDFSEFPVWNPSYMRPSSFGLFYSGYGDSSTDCARVASLLGYNLILLVGFDGHIAVSPDGFVDRGSWGIPDVFNGKGLNMNDMVECPVCRTTEGLDEARRGLWDAFLFSEYLAGNPFSVWNCTKGSSLTNIEYHDLDESMEFLRRVS